MTFSFIGLQADFWHISPGKLYAVCFAPNKEVFANISQVTPKMSEINGSLSLMLLASCIVIVVDLNNKKSKLL
ncbi:MAG: hypothetical protein ACLR5R_07100 [Eubacterium sp.]|uniref:hypothetical protein n=1 Tax=Eubacterium sp. TaxID=142586 RepID=UPI0039A073DB